MQCEEFLFEQEALYSGYEISASVGDLTLLSLHCRHCCCCCCCCRCRCCRCRCRRCGCGRGGGFGGGCGCGCGWGGRHRGGEWWWWSLSSWLSSFDVVVMVVAVVVVCCFTWRLREHAIFAMPEAKSRWSCWCGGTKLSRASQGFNSLEGNQDRSSMLPAYMRQRTKGHPTATIQK